MSPAETNPIRRKIETEIPWGEVEKNIPDTIREFQENANIKGFRKGKAPDNVIKAQVGEKKIFRRAAEKAMHDAFEEAIKDKEKKPIIPPDFKLEEVREGELVRFTAEYYVAPPDPKKFTEDAKKKGLPGIISPEDVFPQGPPNIQSHGPYNVPIDILRSIPGVDLGDKFIPNVAPKIPSPESIIPQEPKIKTEIPDPEKLIEPLNVKPVIPRVPNEEKEPAHNPEKPTQKNTDDSESDFHKEFHD